MATLPPIGTYDQWLAASRELVAEEKKLTRMADELSKKRRQLPMVEVTKGYTFTGPDGEKLSLSDLFHGRRQLIVYHFMFAPEDTKGCSGCSFLCDHINIPQLSHLAQRDTSLVVVSRGQIEKLQSYRKANNWKFPWVSSYNTTFNFDFHVAQDDKITEPMYNFKTKDQLMKDNGWKEESFHGGENIESPGMSTFLKTDDGKVYHTYSAFARGGEIILPTLKWLDMTALGRQEGSEFKNEGMDFKRPYEYDEKVLSHCVKVD